MAVPAETPLTTPDEPIVATAVLLLTQAPPPVASLRLVVVPAQSVVDPVIAATLPVTVTT